MSAIQSHPREALPGGVLELSEGARATTRSRRRLSRCVKLKPLPGTPNVVRVPVLPNVTCAPRTPMEVETPRLPKFKRMPGRSFIERRKRNPIWLYATSIYERPATVSHVRARCLRIVKCD